MRALTCHERTLAEADDILLDLGNCVTVEGDPMTDESGENGKKGGFFRKLMKMAIIAAVVTAVVQVVKRRRGKDLDDVEWQELPPPAGG